MGDSVLQRRALNAVRGGRNQDRQISNRLVPRTGSQVYFVIRRAGGAAFFFLDVAAGLQCSDFAHPIHSDNLVPIDIPELGVRFDRRVHLRIGDATGEVLRQASDERVLVRFADVGGRWVDFSHEDYVLL